MSLPGSVTTVLFDMDGVLIDTRDAVHAAYTDWAEKNDLNPAEVLDVIHGRRTVEVMAMFGFGEDPEAAADDLELAIARRASINDEIVPTCDLYRSLNPDRVAIATSARRETALTNLRVLGLETPKVLVTGQDIKSGKPSPDPYLLAADRLGVEPSECVVVEDAPAGIQAGKSAGCLVVALLTSHSAAQLEAADWVIGPNEIGQLFSGLLS